MNSISSIFLTILVLLYNVPTAKTQSIEEITDWSFRNINDTVWHTATVPGSVFNDLLNLNIMPDPFWGKNELLYKQIENSGWEFKATINLTKQDIQSNDLELVFHGIDTYADIYVNSIKIGNTYNMFRKWVFDVSSYIQPGPNEISLRFQSPINVHKKDYIQAPYRLPAENDSGEFQVSPYSRKAPYQFGWDWAPRMVSVGLWKKVELIKHSGFEIRDMYVEQHQVNAQKANLTIHYEVVNPPTKSIHIYTVAGVDTFSFAYNKTPKDTTKYIHIRQPLQIQKPKLWWTHDHGNPNITHIKSHLISGKDTATYNRKVALCSIKLIQEKDSIGSSFYFTLNGRPIFIKGANYIPQHPFPSTVSDNQYQELIQQAKDAHFNMLRVWGGGIYEKDLFYENCLEKGILIWQDLMFACSLYPGDPSFLQNVENELIDNLSRLRNYHNIALWCGNNEIDVAWHNWGWQLKYGYTKQQEEEIWNHYKRLFHQLIPSIIDSLCTTDYVSTSPLSNWGKAANFNHSSMHYWGVWHGREPIEQYRNNVGRFMSEYGFQSFPDLQTIRGFADKENRTLDSEIMRHHQKSYIGNVMIQREILSHFPMPKHFSQTVYLSQLTQALAMKIAIGAHRIQKGHCMGTLLWQFNDCWPGPSWSLIDFNQRNKAALFTVSEMYQPICMYLDKSNTSNSLYLLNDTHIEKNIELLIEKKSFNGKLIHSQKIPIQLKEDKHQIIDLKKGLLKKGKQRHYIKTSIISQKDSITQFHFLQSDKKLHLVNQALKIISKKHNNDIYEIKIKASVFTKDIYIDCNDENLFVTDNFFDMEAGQIKTIFIKEKSKVLSKKEPLLTFYTLNQL